MPRGVSITQTTHGERKRRFPVTMGGVGVGPLTPAMNCTGGHTDVSRSTNSSCSCYAPFRGTRCESMLEYWIPLSIFLASVDGLVMLLALVWTGARLWSVARAKQCGKRRMADAVVVMNGIAVLMQLITDVLPSASVTGQWPSDIGVAITSGILIILNMALWMAASALALGFWLDVLRQKMKVRLRPCTRILCLAGASLLIVVVPGILLLYVFAGLTTTTLIALASFLLVLPFFLNTLIMVTVASIITAKLKHRLAEMRETSRERAVRARRWIWILTSGWLGYIVVIVVVLASGVDTSHNQGSLTAVVHVYGVMLLLCRAVVTLSILALADGRRLTQWWTRKKDLLGAVTTTTTANSRPVSVNT